MTELLVLPAWNVGPTPFSEWVEALTKLGHLVEVERESAGVNWLMVPALLLRGYGIVDGLSVDAINFELEGFDTAPARLAVEQAANALSWEVHDDDDDDDDDSDDDE